MKKNLEIKKFSLKVKAGLMLLIMSLAFFVGDVKTAQALGAPVIDTALILQNVQAALQKKQESLFKTWGAKIATATIRNTLNRIALSAATYVATAGEGQKPTYVVENFGTYWKNIGDAAAGDFIDGLGKQWQVDLCQPLDANIQAKISLGLVQTMAPASPNCTLSNLVSNYSTAYEKYSAMSSGDYLKGVQVSFDPGGSELSSAFTLFGRTEEASTKAADTEKTSNTITQGWLDVRNIAGKLKGTPGESQRTLANAESAQTQNLLSTTGDALVDAANTFLNQLAYEGFQRVMREISKGKSSSSSYDVSKLTSGSAFESLIQYGESVISEKLATIVKPHFDVRSDYSILSELASCSDSANPGPDNCVIDDKFSQAISEKLTVGDALADGYLHGNWLVTTDNKADNSYTLRNVSILRKYRIVPVGWEQAINIASTKPYKVTFQDLLSCFDGNDDINIFSSDFDKSDTAWCKGLVDPNWVLKAPLNYCSKEGIGGQIANTLVSKDDNNNSTLTVSRASNYCADNQSCIKEKNDGSCEAYGYCNEEKRTWNFSSDSCEPVFNTCKTFTNTSNNQVASMLENTVDYSTCNAGNSGCKQYYSNGTYASSTGQITWDKNSAIFLNNQAVSCDSSNEGCTKLLRGKPGWTDVNFIMDSDFNNTDSASNSAVSGWLWPTKNAVSSVIADDNEKVLNVAGSSGASIYSNSLNSLIPKGLTAISGWSYTLSADIKINSGSNVVMSLGDSNNFQAATTSDWTTISVTVPGSSINNLDFSITGYGPSVNFSIKHLKLSPNNFYSGYSSYAAFPVYEKLIPAYLESACYMSASSGDYRLKDDAPDVCNNYARKCNRQEAGCELFTAVKDSFSVAAKANVSDYCDAKCVGYNTYIAKSSYFYGNSADNLIPDSATACSAQSAGCASFTNLDTAAAGGEGLEYYSKVQQCIKPDSGSCSDFYSWDNSQLKVMSLKKDSGGNPFTIDSAGDAACTKEIYNLPITDPRYNSDCREFYNKSGQISYHLMTNTVSCSSDCHAYRLNETNIDKNLDSASCTGSDKSWDSSQGACRVCKNGGTWNSSQNACVYQVIPDEGTTCSAQEVGCREYNGNFGSDVKLMASYNFETDTDDFTGSVVQNNESTAKDGHSLTINGTGTVSVQSFVKKDSAYVVKFIAKAASNTNVKFSFVNAAGEEAVFNTDSNNTSGNLVIKGGNEWNLYEINLSDLNHDLNDEKLSITSAGGIYIDNLTINEISDRYYLIKGSSVIPDVCSYDMSDNYQGPDYNLGCQQYKDRAGTINNLRQFSELCQNSAVGCEQMIQTHDSSNFYDYNVNLNGTTKTAICTPGTAGCLAVKGHQVLYAVFDAAKQCNQTDAGCTRFGYSKISGATTNWADVYKKNLPDTYNSETASPLCQASEVGCETWTYGSAGSNSYFKDPGLNTCIYKSGAWYKSPVKRCDLNGDGNISGAEQSGSICVSDSDCGSRKCVTDSNNYPCNVSYLKTMGLGGNAGKIATPDGLVGMCNVESSGCSEYIDPSSKFVNNLIYNPAAEDIDGDGVGGDKWTYSPSGYYQRISIQPNKLYVLQTEASSTTVSLKNFGTAVNNFSGQVRIMGADNNLGNLVSSVYSSGSIVFNSGSNNYVSVYRPNITTQKASPAASVSLREAIINYQLDSNIDTASCNGVVNTDKGCILFNARTQAGRSGLKRLIFDAYGTGDGSAPVTCNSNNCSANQVIKVSPDRVCSRWLSCQTYAQDSVTGEKTCYSMGECNQLNDKNECSNFLSLSNIVRSINNTQNKNATGYSLLNNYYLGSMKEVGQNTSAHFDFESNMVGLSCRRDIDVPSSNTALYAQKNKACLFDKNINDSLVLTPDDKGTDYPAHGKGYIKVLNYYQISPMSANSSIPLYTDQDYYINYLVNTNGSSAKAKLLITNASSNAVIASSTDEAPNGWERKVWHFKINDTTKHQTNVKIYLTSNTTKTDTGYVYFDDINIEPVLKTTDNSYVAKDCRLYPSDDSLTCSSVNNNVVKDGLYGYCLQYDPLNKGVCQLWYPIDKIAPITRNTESVLGYSGKIPLYYCSEVNGKFKFIEKRIGAAHGFSGGKNSDFSGNIKRMLPEADQDLVSGVSSDDAGKDQVVSRYGASCSNYGVTATGDNGIGGDLRCFCFNDTVGQRLCGSSDYAAVGSVSGGVKKWFGYYCVPKKSNLSVISNSKTVFMKDVFTSENTCSFTFSEGWGQYNGFLNDASRYSSAHDVDMAHRELLEDINEETNGKTAGYDSVMVIGNDDSAESDIKYISNQDPESAYHLTCNRFVQVVDNEGNNMAWSGRIGRNSDFATSTPTFFPSSYGLSLYGRNREDVPFGSSIITSSYDLTNSGLINLRNQYSSKNNETVLAGRPYGCSMTGNTLDSGCSNIGQCSLNPNVFCLYISGNSEINKKSCAGGGNGECVKLWNSAPTYSNADSILNTLFNKKYGDYVYGSNGYQLVGGNSFSVPASALLPSIANAKIKFGTTILPISDGSINITNGNLYELEFNTSVTSEQQPLKQIIIDWGDGNTQIITNTDNLPEAGVPHRFYHYYKIGKKHVEIKIIDNWEKCKYQAMSGAGWADNSCSVLN